MIQRIQTVYLLVSTLLSGGLVFYLNLWTSGDATVFALDLLQHESLTFSIIPVLFFGAALLSFFAIFSFKNRQKQFVIGRLSILINLFLLGLLIYVSLTVPGETSVSEKGIGMFIPIVAILFNVLANKAIKKDEDLVKSVDRLR